MYQSYLIGAKTQYLLHPSSVGGEGPMRQVTQLTIGRTSRSKTEVSSNFLYWSMKTSVGKEEKHHPLLFILLKKLQKIWKSLQNYFPQQSDRTLKRWLMCNMESYSKRKLNQTNILTLIINSTILGFLENHNHL